MSHSTTLSPAVPTTDAPARDPRRLALPLAAIAVALLLIFASQFVLNEYWMRVFVLCGVYVILALGLNLINGFTGLFSLGHAGFMAVGAYTVALLTMSPEVKATNFYLAPLVGPLQNVQLPFIVALVIATLLTALVALLIAIPALRLRDDYLAIATLGFSEIIRVVFTNTQTLTNGSLGLKNIPELTNVWWAWGLAILTVIFMVRLVHSSFGRSLKAIREDEVAAAAMGINLYRSKIISFVIGSALAGLGGGLLATLIGTIDPTMFRFLLTFNILLIVVLGGLGSISGSVIAAVVITAAMELLRFLDETVRVGDYEIAFPTGLRMVVFSVLLMAVVLFWREGLMGKNELTPAYLRSRFGRRRKAAASDTEAPAAVTATAAPTDNLVAGDAVIDEPGDVGGTSGPQTRVLGTETRDADN